MRNGISNEDAVLLFAILREQKKTKGKARLTNMLRSGKELKVFAVKDTDLQLFCREAKKYGVLYCVLKDKNAKDGITDVMVRAEDASKINRIFERFDLATVDMAEIRSEIERSRTEQQPDVAETPAAAEPMSGQETEDLDSLHAELAEIDENVIRTGLSDLELSELLARRKKIYETLHPATIARNLPGHASNYESSSDKLTGEEKPFSQDTAEKMGVSPRTVERHVQIGENLTPETKEILRGTDRKVTKQNLTKLSRLEPEQQTEAAKRLTEGTIKSVDEYTTEGVSTKYGDNYYRTGAFIVDAFSEQNGALNRVPEAYKLHLEHYREILSPEQIKAMIGIAEDSIKLLEDYVAFLNNELEVFE